MAYTLEDVRRALQLAEFDSVAAQRKMMPTPRAEQRPPALPGEARLGSVLLLLYHKDREVHLVLTRRHDDLGSHAGQISFPGGRHEGTETLQTTALRETFEELGIAPNEVNVLGKLTPLYIPASDFHVHPFVAWSRGDRRPSFQPDPREVSEVIEVPLRYLLRPETRRQEPWNFRGHRIEVPYFAVDHHKVWGATAMMLSEFLERLRALDPQPAP